MQRLAPAVAFALALFLGGLLDVAPIHAAEEKAVDAPQAERAKAPLPGADVKVIEVPVDSPKNPIPGGPNDQNALWWNDPKIVKALSLTDEQRKKMEALLTAYREKVPQNRKPEAFQEALVQGDWKTARNEGEKLAEAAETSIRMRGALKIDVISLLSKEQRQTLVDRYPRLIYKPWRRAMRGASSR